MKYAWIDERVEAYPVGVMCQVLGVSRSGLYAWRKRPESKRAQSDRRLTQEIRALQRIHRGRYGRRRMHEEIGQGRGTKVGQRRVGRLMREAGLQCTLRRRYRVVTTDSKHKHPIAPNVLARDFTARAPDRKWVADLTYVATLQGWLYVALIMDLFSRKIVGWAMHASMEVDLTLEALRVAFGWREISEALVHHSDRGSTYAAGDYRKELEDRHIQISMSRKGNCWDNAAMESLNGTFKVECVHPEEFETHEQAQQAILEYIGYYNTTRRHSALGYVSPARFERQWRESKQVAQPEAVQ